MSLALQADSLPAEPPGSPVMKRPDSKYFSLCKLHGLNGSYLPLPWESQSSHCQKVSERMKHGTSCFI